MLTRRAVVLAGIQSGSGVPATLYPELNAILVSDLNWTPDAPALEQNSLTDTLSPRPIRTGRKLLRATFTFQLAPGPSLGARPAVSPFLRMAGMQETFTGAVVTSIRTAALKWTASAAGGTGVFSVDLQAGGDPTITNPQVVREGGLDMRRATSISSIQKGEFIYGDFDTLGFSTIYVKLSDSADPDSKALDFLERVASVTEIDYKFRDSSFELGTVDMYPDGHLLRTTDAVANFTSISFAGGNVINVQCEIQGTWTTPTDVVLPTAIYLPGLPPIAQSMAFTIDGYSAGVVPSWTVNYGNQIGERQDLNSANGFKGLAYVGRQPSGQVTMEQVSVATWPAYTRWENATEMTWQAVLGSAGTRLTFSGPSAQIVSIAPTDIGGIRGWQLSLRYNGTSSTREFNIKLD